MVPQGAPASWWPAVNPTSQQSGSSAPLQQQQQHAPVVAGAPGAGAPVQMPPLMQMQGLVQQRARVQPPAVLPQHDNGSSGAVPGAVSMSTSAAAGLWRSSNTSRAVQELQVQVNKVFRRPGTGGNWGAPGYEVLAPVENLTSALTELSKLIQNVIAFCEAENLQKGFAEDGGRQQLQALQASTQAAAAASKFPVEAFVEQGRDYARRVTQQMRALRDMLNVVLAASSNKATVLREVQQFNAAVADSKEVYQLGSQVSSAAVGAVLPYLSTCSFFSKNGPHGAYRLWSLVGARINSSLRYMFQVLEVARKTSGRLLDLVSGKIQPQSLLDFARSKPFFRAAAYLETADARSVSAVSYFNELAAAFQQHTSFPALSRPHAAAGGAESSSSHRHRHHLDLNDDEQQTFDEDAQAEFSLMAEDLSPEPQRQKSLLGEADDQAREDLQTAVDDAPFLWAAPKDRAVREFEEGSSDMQTVDNS